MRNEAYVLSDGVDIPWYQVRYDGSSPTSLGLPNSDFRATSCVPMEGPVGYSGANGIFVSDALGGAPGAFSFDFTTNELVSDIAVPLPGTLGGQTLRVIGSPDNSAFYVLETNTGFTEMRVSAFSMRSFAKLWSTPSVAYSGFSPYTALTISWDGSTIFWIATSTPPKLLATSSGGATTTIHTSVSSGNGILCSDGAQTGNSIGFVDLGFSGGPIYLAHGSVGGGYAVTDVGTFSGGPFDGVMTSWDGTHVYVVTGDVLAYTTSGHVWTFSDIAIGGPEPDTGIANRFFVPRHTGQGFCATGENSDFDVGFMAVDGSGDLVTFFNWGSDESSFAYGLSYMHPYVIAHTAALRIPGDDYLFLCGRNAQGIQPMTYLVASGNLAVKAPSVLTTAVATTTGAFAAAPIIGTPTRQKPRDDNLALGAPRQRVGKGQPSSVQNSYRTGVRGTYS